MQPTGQPEHRRTLDKDEIRLLVYDEKQSQRYGRLVCQTRIQRLSLVNARRDRPYTALSYVWGDAAITKPVICDAVEVQVTVNLHYALSVVWNKLPNINFWADALSITQDNLCERNHQVSLMGDIFRSAGRVLVSLGPPLKGENRFWTFLQNFASNEYSVAAEFEDEFDELMDGLPNKLALGMDDLIKRPWFRRAWTYQEIRLAVEAEAFCGDSFMPWNEFVAALDRLEMLGAKAARDPLDDWKITDAYRGTFSPLSTFMKNDQAFMLKRPGEEQASGLSPASTVGLQRDLQKEKLLKLLSDGWPRDASDARDKIYAFTSSLLASASYVELRPDYTLDLRSTYIRLVRTLINNENNLEFLKLARGVDEPIPMPYIGIWDNEERTPRALKVQRLPEGHLSTYEEKDDPEGFSEIDGLPSWACDWRRRGLRPKVDMSPFAMDSYYFRARQNVLPLRQSAHDFDKRLVLRGAALARAGCLQTETATSSSKQLGTFSRLPRCALHRAASSGSVRQELADMFDPDVQSGKKSLTASNMVPLLLQTLLHDQSGCDCPQSLEQDLLKAHCPYATYPRSCVANLDWLFVLDGLDEPVILRPHITPGEAVSSRWEIGFDFVSVCPLNVDNWREWGRSPFAYGEIVLF